MEYTPVLIVGGSLVGLSAALFLAWRRVPVILVEKHHGSSPHPRATGFTEHTLEFFRAVGIANKVPEVDVGTRLRRVTAESLSGKWHEEILWTPGELGTFGTKSSPCSGAAIAQDKLEPILRDAARAEGADIRTGVEMVAFVNSTDGIVARMRVRDSGEQYTINADYMIAADGADSPVREALGIRRIGVGHLRTLRSVLFRCAEADTFLSSGVQQFEVHQPNFRAFLTSYGDSRWVLMFDDDLKRSETELAEAIISALGREMALEILASGRWEMAGRIAERYSLQRVFLAGDAAHQLPPTRGGFGANTGIDDAYNLAWKLEAVLAGRSHDTLLDTYSEERQPIGWLRHQQTFARPDYARWVHDAFKNEKLFGNEAMELGQLQRSSAIIDAGLELPPAAHPNEWAGQPGVRAPHLWVKSIDNGIRSSTIDLFTREFVLISSDLRWIAAANDVAADLSISINAVLIGRDLVVVEGGSFEERFGLSSDGASLVRPDGIIAWRSKRIVEDPVKAVRDAVMRAAALRQPRPSN